MRTRLVACGLFTLSFLSFSTAGSFSTASPTAIGTHQTTPDSEPPGRVADGIWIGRAELAAMPMHGAAWDALLRRANSVLGPPDIADQNSHHDTGTLAAALVAARTGDPNYRDRAIQDLLAAMGTERKPEARWLAAGRNVTAYVIAADVLGLRADGDPQSVGTQVERWIRGWLTTELRDNTRPVGRTVRPFGGGSNADAQEGALYTAVAAYLRDRTALDTAWGAFLAFVCDAAAPATVTPNLEKGVDYGWAYSDEHPCAVNPKGSTKLVPPGRKGAGELHRIDGALINDMRRGGPYQWPPTFTAYPWTGLAGLVPAATILQRAGYPAFEAGDRAVLRAVEFLSSLAHDTDPSWFDGDRGSEVVQLVNHYYGTSFPVRVPVAEGHTVGFTDWTHPVRPR